MCFWPSCRSREIVATFPRHCFTPSNLSLCTRRIRSFAPYCWNWKRPKLIDSSALGAGSMLSESGYGTKRNCLAARGISGAEGRPGVPSACRQPPPVTQTGPSRGLRRTGGEGSDAFLRAPPICSNRAGFVTLTGVEQGAAQQSTPTMPSRSGAARDVAVGGIAPGRRVQRFRAVDSKFVATDCG
jgi:hypothetical protein